MSSKYRYGHKPSKHRSRKVLFIVILPALLIVIAIVAFVLLDIFRNSQQQVVQGNTRIIKQAADSPSQKLRIDEPTFYMELPKDWKLIKRVKDTQQNSVTWEAKDTSNNTNSRSITVYVDTIPPSIPINKLLPVTVRENKLLPGELSRACETYTKGGTPSAKEATKLPVTAARWAGVDFLCNLPNINENQIGTGSPEGINVVSVTGPEKGAHKYFFLFTDHSIQPNYALFNEAISSFRAK